MTCEIVAAPAAIAQMLSADRSIRGTVSAPNIIITRFERDSPLFGGFYFYYYYRRDGRWVTWITVGFIVVNTSAKRDNWGSRKYSNTLP